MEPVSTVSEKVTSEEGLEPMNWTCNTASPSIASCSTKCKPPVDFIESSIDQISFNDKEDAISQEEIPNLVEPAKCKGINFETSTKILYPDSEGRRHLRSWLNQHMRIEMSDGRILIGIFLCTDREGNVILGSCTEYINPKAWGFSDEPRLLGLVMVPGRHIISVQHDKGVPSAPLSLKCPTTTAQDLSPSTSNSIRPPV